jgi:hypothetical protein
MMTENDKSLIRQLMSAGRHNVVYDLLPEYNLLKSREIIEQMGNKWCCHPDNAVKKLEIPVAILDAHKKESIVLTRFKESRKK